VKKARFCTLGWYNLQESELETASLLDRWLYWLLHAHQYDAQTLGSLFSQIFSGSVVSVLHIEVHMEIYAEKESPLEIIENQYEIDASISDNCESVSICLLIFGVVETIGFFLIVSMCFIYPFLSVVILLAILVFQNLDYLKSWRRFFGLPFLVLVGLVLQLGPVLCFFSPSLERLYDLPFTVIRKIF